MQINGCFENGWHDASAVMIRRLLETLIIEVFEYYKIASRIQNSAGRLLLFARPHWRLSSREDLEFDAQL